MSKIQPYTIAILVLFAVVILYLIMKKKKGSPLDPDIDNEIDSGMVAKVPKGSYSVFKANFDNFQMDIINSVKHRVGTDEDKVEALIKAQTALPITPPNGCTLNFIAIIPSIKELRHMNKADFDLISKCGILKSIVKLWAIGYWSRNTPKLNIDHLSFTLSCMDRLTYDKPLLYKFQKVVEQCFNATVQAFNGSGNGNGVVVADDKLYLMPPLQQQAMDALAAINSQTTNVQGWETPGYYNYGYGYASKAGLYSLPRNYPYPSAYMTRAEIDATVSPAFEPSQWIVTGERPRPWEPRYPILSIPPTPIPLLGTE